jgi:hypothetical protein
MVALDLRNYLRFPYRLVKIVACRAEFLRTPFEWQLCKMGKNKAQLIVIINKSFKFVICDEN